MDTVNQESEKGDESHASPILHGLFCLSKYQGIYATRRYPMTPLHMLAVPAALALPARAFVCVCVLSYVCRSTVCPCPVRPSPVHGKPSCCLVPGLTWESVGNIEKGESSTWVDARKRCLSSVDRSSKRCEVRRRPCAASVL